MSETPVRGKSAPVKTNPLRPGGLTLIDLVVFCGGGYIPEEGEFNQRVWSGLLGVSESTVKDWIDRYRIPHRRPGNDVYVDARDLRSHLPRKYWED